MLKVSAVIMCRDEERYIARCLNSLIGVIDDIVVVDTGSMDRTENILAGYGNKVRSYSYKWSGSFSVVRNYGMSLAKNDWVIFIYADEVLLKNAGLDIIMKNGTSMLDAYCSDTLSLTIIDSASSSLSTIPRIIKRSSGGYYHGNVHELILARDGTERFSPAIPITFKHYGYQPYIQWVKGKFYRNISLLRDMLVQERSVYRWKYFYVRNSISNGSLNKRIFKESINVIDYSFSHPPESWCDGINLTIKIMALSKMKGNVNVIVYLYNKYRHLTVCNAIFLYYINEMINRDERSKAFIYENIQRVNLEYDFNFAKSQNAYVITQLGSCCYVSELTGVVDMLL